MLLDCPFPDAFLTKNVLHYWEQIFLFVVMVSMHELVPRERVPNEARIVAFSDVWCLEVDRVEATEDRIVYKRHMRRASNEGIVLDSIRCQIRSQSYNAVEQTYRNDHTFPVVNCGVETSGIGPSAHCFVGAVAFAIEDWKLE